jgi:hypothetical protein
MSWFLDTKINRESMRIVSGASLLKSKLGLKFGHRYGGVNQKKSPGLAPASDQMT